MRFDPNIVYTAEEVANLVGEPTENLVTTAMWGPAFFGSYRVSWLIYAAGVEPNHRPFRILKDGEIVASRIPSEQVTPDDAVACQTWKDAILGGDNYTTANILPKIHAAVPDLDPESDALVFIQRGRFVMADYVDGKLLNLRPKPEGPMISLDLEGIVVVTDHMEDAHQEAIAVALSDVTERKVAVVVSENVKPAVESAIASANKSEIPLTP